MEISEKFQRKKMELISPPILLLLIILQASCSPSDDIKEEVARPKQQATKPTKAGYDLQLIVMTMTLTTTAGCGRVRWPTHDCH